MKLLKVSITHSELIAEMHDKCFEESWSKEDFEKLMANKFSKVLMVANEDGDEAIPMGFILFQQVEDGQEAEIITICTLPKYRKIGVAKTLVENIDANKVFLEVCEDNLDAVGLYEHLGFEIENKRVNYYGGGIDALVMAKNRTRADF